MKSITQTNFGAATMVITQVSLLLSLVLLGNLTGTVIADDWPHWMGPTNDGAWNETGILEKFPESGPDVLWRHEIGAGYAGPSIADGKVFLMGRISDKGKGIKVENGIKKSGEIAGGERIECLDLKTGKPIWSHFYDCPYNIAYPTGPRCTPTIDGEHVYMLGAMGHLKCLTVAKGEVVWEKLLTKEYEAKPPLWGYASHPIIDGENLIVPVGGIGSGIVAFNKKTGKEIWRSVTTTDIGYAPLVIYNPKDTDGKSSGERQMIFWHATGITAVNPADGQEFWHTKFPEEVNPSVVTIATPILIGNRLLISEFYKGAIMLELGSNPPSVKEVWRDNKKGERLKDAMNSMMATPIIKDSLAYGVAYNKRGQGILRCIELATGDMKWADEDWLAEKPQLFANGFITPNEDKVLIFDDLGELIIGKLSPTGFEELDRAKLLEPTSVASGRDVVWSHPAYSDGSIVVRNDKEIIRVNLKK